MPQYRSKFRAFRVNIRPQVDEYHPQMPVIVKTHPEMVAEFGVHRPEVEVETDAGVERYGDISGFFYDLDADATEKGWTDEEYQIAKARLDSLCETWPEAIWPLEQAAPAAPFPTYDTLDPKQVAVVAAASGLVGQALAYEKANQNRAAVIEDLEEALEQGKLEAELTAS